LCGTEYSLLRAPFPERPRLDQRVTKDREAEDSTGRRSLTAPNGRQVVAATARRYVFEVLRLAGTMSVLGNSAEYGQVRVGGITRGNHP
jgi:hypothetical protein